MKVNTVVCGHAIQPQASSFGARVRENRSYNENAYKGWLENWWRVIYEVEATIGTVAIAPVSSKVLNFVHHLISTNNWKEVRAVFILLAVCGLGQVSK